MKIEIQNFLKNSFILSQSDDDFNVDRCIFKHHDLFPIRRFDGYSNSIGSVFGRDVRRIAAYNCSLGHVSIIRMAKCLNLPFVAIFDDSAYPTNNIVEKLNVTLNEVPDNASVLVLGWYKDSSKTKRISDQIVEMKTGFWGYHAYIIFKKAYGKYLNFYDDNSGKYSETNADEILKIFSNDGLYRSFENLFIRHHENGSVNNQVFLYDNSSHQVPKTGFPEFGHVLKKFILEKQMNKIEKYSNKYNFPKGDKCLVIGANRSVLDFHVGDYINTGGRFIIRINRLPNPEFYDNYGSRTDLFFGCKYHEDKLESVSNKILLTHGDILDISKDFELDGKWLTTGFLAILFALKNFNDVHVFGFGYPDREEPTDVCQNTYDKNGAGTTNHDLNFEHQQIYKFHTNLEFPKLKILELSDIKNHMFWEQDRC